MSRPKLDPDADGKQWLYKGFVIVDQNGTSPGLPAFSFFRDDDDTFVYPADDLREVTNKIDRMIEQDGWSVLISADQHRALQRLWFIFGNNGHKHSAGNHYFIQRLLDSAKDTRTVYRPSHNLTSECINAVDAIIKPQHTSVTA